MRGAKARDFDSDRLKNRVCSSHRVCTSPTPPKEFMTPEIRMIAVDALIPYARNARTHSDGQVAQIAASIAEFGFTNPILSDGERGVIAGHGRLMAARKLGLTEVPVIELAHLTPTQKKAYILADNRIAENAGWDEELLKLELAELQAAEYDLDLMGFSDEEIDKLLNGDEQSDGLTDEDAVPETPVEPTSKPGDLWILGYPQSATRGWLECADPVADSGARAPAFEPEHAQRIG